MEPMEALKNEHGLIRQFLENLERAAINMKDGVNPPREFFDKALLFAREFADDYHHIKEEHMLFVRVAQHETRPLTVSRLALWLASLWLWPLLLTRKRAAQDDASAADPPQR